MEVLTHSRLESSLFSSVIRSLSRESSLGKRIWTHSTPYGVKNQKENEKAIENDRGRELREQRVQTFPHGEFYGVFHGVWSNAVHVPGRGREREGG